ncbi:MAG TPA: GH25 family lysozyme [Hyphomonas sp.]|nr:GH25 family lysozyme [Hyphomonas sp.]
MTLTRWILPVLILCAACARSAEAPDIEPVSPAPGAEGIDLSHHNGRIDWDRLGEAPLDFIYLKATEGRDWKDPRFQDNWLEATQRGWHVGAYHFYLLCKDGPGQAANFIQSVEVRNGTLPPAVDLEYAHNCQPSASRDATLSGIRAFLEALEAEYGTRPVLYTTPDFYADWLATEFPGYRIWMRSLSGPPGRKVWIWQYSMKGRVPGVEGFVDLNRMPEGAAQATD